MERVRDIVIARSLPRSRGSDGAGYRPRIFEDGLVLLCCLALVGVLVFGALLGLFYWVVTTLPASLIMACPEPGGCVAPGSDQTQAEWLEDVSGDGPKMVP